MWTIQQDLEIDDIFFRIKRVHLHYLKIKKQGDKIMIESRPEFDKITSFDAFTKYYWYREELSQICKFLD